MKSRHLVFIIAYFLTVTDGYAQTGDPYTKNVAVIGRDNFGRAASGDVWGVKIGDVHYALATIDGGLSIVRVNAVSPSYYEEVAYVNHDDYYDPQIMGNLSFDDVETFVVGDSVFAACGIAEKSANPVVFIVQQLFIWVQVLKITLYRFHRFKPPQLKT